MMKAAYLPASLKKQDAGSGTPFFTTPTPHHDEEIAGPDARFFITKMLSSTPEKEIKRLSGTSDEPEAGTRNHDFYTLIFSLNIQLGEPSTTRFINAMVSFSLPSDGKILTYSPKEKEIIIEIARQAGDELFLSPALAFSAIPPCREENQDDPENLSGIRVGPDEEITVTFSKKHGYLFIIPKSGLLEYEGMRKNEHEVYWEIYPPMPPEDRENSVRGKHAVFSLIVQVPRNTRPEITVHIEGRVKGEIWGVVPLKGSVDFLNKSRRFPSSR